MRDEADTWEPAPVWWDVARGYSGVDLTGEPTVVADAALQDAIRTVPWDEPGISAHELRQLEDYLHQSARLAFREATVEDEADFVDRPLDGEVVLSAPDEDSILMFAAAPDQQILAAPVRWRVDVHENLCTLVESRLAEQPRADRIRQRLAGRFNAVTLRSRALRRLRDARATAEG